MIALLCFVMAALAAPFKSKSWLEAGNATLRHQLIVVCTENFIRIDWSKESPNVSAQ